MEEPFIFKITWEQFQRLPRGEQTLAVQELIRAWGHLGHPLNRKEEVNETPHGH